MMEKEDKKADVCIVDGKYRQDPEKMAELKEQKIYALYLDNYRRMEVIKELTTIHFTNLRCLMLRGSEIESVQGLVSLSMPHIREINLAQNHITCLKPLRKAAWTKLTSLFVGNNQIRDHHSLTSSHLPSIEHLWCSCIGTNVDPFFPSKLQTQHISWLSSVQRHNANLDTSAIKRCIKKVLERRWKNATLL